MSAVPLVLAAASACAATYEVGTGKPYATIQAAVTQAHNDLVNNVYQVPATITVFGGTYVEGIDIPADPTNNQFVFTKYDNWRMEAAPGANVLVRGYIQLGQNREAMTFDGINVDNSHPTFDINFGAAYNFLGNTTRDNVVKNAVIWGVNQFNAAARGNFQYGVNTFDHVTMYNTDYGFTANSNSRFDVTNSIVAFNANRGLFSVETSQISYSNFFSNGTTNFEGSYNNAGGNINFPGGANPQFVTTDSASPYFLQLHPLLSPCINAASDGTNMGARPTYQPVWNVNSNGNWSNASNWLFNIVPNFVNAGAVLSSAINAPRTINVDVAVTAGSITFDNANSYSVSGANTITMDVSSGSAALNVVNGSHSINAPLALADDLVVTVSQSGAALTVSNLQASTKALTQSGAGLLTVNRIRAAGLTVNAGTVTVSANGTDSGVTRVGALTLAGGATPTATLDLNDNDLIVTSGSIGTVAAQVAAARNGGAWDARGITSSAARTQSSSATTLGVVAGADYISVNGTSFGGLTVAGGDTLVKYTWYGDTDFTGVVDFDDYVRIDAGFNTSATGWFNGDFDLSGTVDFDDYVLIDLGFNTQSGTLRRATDYIDGTDRDLATMNMPALQKVVEHFERFGTDFGTHFLSAVPEPSLAGVILGLVSCGALARRRR